MTTDFRALCAELADELDAKTGYTRRLDGQRITHPTVTRARAALAEPEPEGPTREDAIAVYSQVMAAHQCETLGEMAEHFARAVLARWGTPNLSETRSSLEDAPQPVSVSERWPKTEDCDEEGRCWIHMPDMGTDPSWRLVHPRHIGRYHTHWLPAHALALPTTSD